MKCDIKNDHESFYEIEKTPNRFKQSKSSNRFISF